MESLRNPETLALVKILAKKLNEHWSVLTVAEQEEAKGLFLKVGVERRTSGWAYQLAGRTLLIN